MRVVVDTNVVVSAILLPRSVPRQAFDAAAALGTLLISEATLAELHDVLRLPKFDRYVSEEDRLEILVALVREAEQIEVAETCSVCRDSGDDKFLELALSGKATHLVTGDDDLLVLHPFRGIVVLTPQAFLTSLLERGDRPR